MISTVPIGRSGVCVVDGYGIRVAVNRRRLVIEDGFGPERRRAEFARATCPIKRLVLLGHTGYISLEALRWLADVGIGYIHLDPEGRLLVASAGYSLDDPRLRRMQAVAWGTPIAAAIARELLSRKLHGQAAIARQLGNEPVHESILDLVSLLPSVSTPADMMVVEAAAANAYWGAWSAVPFPWTHRDRERVPLHWRTFGSRASALTGNPRTASNPANSLLNYAYSVAASEARLACLQMGLDPGLGVLHADLKARDSLALDVLEAVRPAVDGYVLELLRREVFRADDFVETRKGSCRMVPALTHHIVESLPIWRRAVGPVVEHIATAFSSGPASRVAELPTHLTGARRSAGRVSAPRKAPGSATTTRRKLHRCTGCGTNVGREQRWCDSCRPAVLAEQAVRPLAVAHARRMEMRAAGRDPATTPAAKAKLRAARQLRVQEKQRWTKSAHGPRTADEFARKIMPRLSGIPLSRLAAATGLSLTYLSEVRAGKKVPHVRWWDALRLVADRRDGAT